MRSLKSRLLASTFLAGTVVSDHRAFLLSWLAGPDADGAVVVSGPIGRSM